MVGKYDVNAEDITYHQLRACKNAEAMAAGDTQLTWILSLNLNSEIDDLSWQNTTFAMLIFTY
jgi:hypothetical protein